MLLAYILDQLYRSNSKFIRQQCASSFTFVWFLTCFMIGASVSCILTDYFDSEDQEETDDVDHLDMLDKKKLINQLNIKIKTVRFFNDSEVKDSDC